MVNKYLLLNIGIFHEIKKKIKSSQNYDLYIQNLFYFEKCKEYVLGILLFLLLIYLFK